MCHRAGVTFEDVKGAFSLGQSRIQSSDGAEGGSLGTSLLGEMAGDVEVVDEELVSLGNEQIRLRLSRLRIQDALLFIVIVHD